MAYPRSTACSGMPYTLRPTPGNTAFVQYVFPGSSQVIHVRAVTGDVQVSFDGGTTYTTVLTTDSCLSHFFVRTDRIWLKGAAAGSIAEVTVAHEGPSSIP